MTELTVDVPGCRLFVRDWSGDGPALLLLHGGGGNVATWDALAPLLASDFRVAAYDSRGHGRSDVPDSVDPADFVDDIDAVAGELGLEDPVLVGHSFGGVTALRYALDHPECRGVACIDGGWVRTDEPVPDRDPARVRRQVREVGLPEERSEFFVQLAVEGTRLARRESVALYADVRCPLLLLFARDGMTYLGPYTDKERAAIDALPHPVRWFDTGHGIHEDQPAEVAAAIREFVGGLP